jgi:hypothetical protein
MVRTGFETHYFRYAVDAFAGILKATCPLINGNQIEEVVSLMESVQAHISGYSLHLNRIQREIVNTLSGSQMESTLVHSA